MKETHSQLFPDPGASPGSHVPEDSGQDLAEYAILTALIVLVVIGVLVVVGEQIAMFYESVVGVLPFSG